MTPPSAPTEVKELSVLRSPSRPGARQRRAMQTAAAISTATSTTHEQTSPSSPPLPARRPAAAAAATSSTSPSMTHNETLEWTESERREALTLIKEMAHAGVAPVELIAQGVRADVVHASCHELNIPLGGFGSSSRVHENEATTESTAMPAAVTSTSRSRRKRKKNTNGSAAAKASQTAAAPAEEAEGNAEEMFELLRQKVALERERAILMRMERKRNEEQRVSMAVAATEGSDEAQDLTIDSAPPNDVASAPARIVQSDPMQAMREAALASMKRKRSPADGGGTTTENAYTPTLPPQSLPANVPRGPKALYRDIDAPQLDAAQREREAAEALLNSYDAVEEQDLQHMQNLRSRVTAASRRSRPMSYVDEDFRYESGAPAGQVDHAAPLPSLLAAPLERKSTDVRQNAVEPTSTLRPPAPFLASNGRQRIVVEFSDDDDEDDDDDDDDDYDYDKVGAHAKRVRKENAQFILQAWQRERGYVEASVSPADVTGTSTPSSGETRALLQSKEREIERLKEKMRLLEQRRKQPSATVTDVTATMSPSSSLLDSHSVLSSEQQQEEKQQQQRKEEGQFPAYESPFARFPGLRRLVEGKGRTGDSR